ncbi:velvet factor-domain-containing protein [Globomyces pollinis-pini]|nr:velvet factor-domain-containing protein [Globomyces pollinis-pini]
MGNQGTSEFQSILDHNQNDKEEHEVSSDNVKLTQPEVQPVKNQELTIVQQPQRARVCGKSLIGSRSVDPPPIVRLQLENDKRLITNNLFVLVATLLDAEGKISDEMFGNLISESQYLYDENLKFDTYFIFPKLCIRKVGKFQLGFRLFCIFGQNMTSLIDESPCIASITSQTFEVYNARKFPGKLDPTSLTKTLSIQTPFLKKRNS